MPLPKPKIVTMKLEDLTDAPYNPRKISPKALKGLATSLKEFGLVQPIVWNKRTKNVVGGHQRLRALRESGETEVPVVVVDIELAKEKALNLTLNNAKIEGEFTEKLDDILAELDASMPELYRQLRLDALQSAETKNRTEKGTVEFTEELMEEHNFVVLYFDNSIDWIQLNTLFPLRSVKALDSKKGFEKIGIGRVIRGPDFIKKITEGR